jgi:hypothetical protein
MKPGNGSSPGRCTLGLQLIQVQFLAVHPLEHAGRHLTEGCVDTLHNMPGPRPDQAGHPGTCLAQPGVNACAPLQFPAGRPVHRSEAGVQHATVIASRWQNKHVHSG